MVKCSRNGFFRYVPTVGCLLLLHLSGLILYLIQLGNTERLRRRVLVGVMRHRGCWRVCKSSLFYISWRTQHYRISEVEVTN
jgi:hypothetical protein